MRSQSPRLAVAVVAGILVVLAAGFALTLLVFYPGYMTADARWVYQWIDPSRRGDWQSPVMSVVWGWIDPLAPGARSMFVLMAILYWAGFGLLAFTVARRSPWAGIAAALFAFAPPAFSFVGMIWRDILFADSWLFAAALAYAVAGCRAAARWPAQAVAFAFVAFGVLLRPNAIVAAPLLATYVLWPTRFDFKRAAILLVPGMIAGYALVHVVYYEALNVRRLSPLHSVVVFDLGGTTYFSGENQFPVSFGPEQDALLGTRQCYDPAKWDAYWMIKPCEFVMHRLESTSDPIFGTRRLTQAWIDAVIQHPLAYLRHRATYFWTFLAKANMALPVLDLDHPTRVNQRGNPWFMRLVAVHNALHPATVLFRPGFWLLLAMLVCALAWRRRTSPSGACAVGVTASAIVYTMTFLPFGVASDFRYIYWMVLATLAGAAALLAARYETATVSRADPTA
ncbi:MAG: hypothetical protein ACRECO_18320 [Xanthobacteraceae bacterium]